MAALIFIVIVPVVAMMPALPWRSGTTGLGVNAPRAAERPFLRGW
jgi:hypothetical protein